MSVSTRAPAKHVHAGDKHASLATNMEYYDMCRADKTPDLKMVGLILLITSSVDEACDRFSRR